MAKRVEQWRDAFIGRRVYSATDASNVGHSWDIVDTSSAGTPTYTAVDNATDAPNGALAVAFDSTTEVQNVCVAHGDQLWLDIDSIIDVTFRVKMNQAAVDSATSFAIGLTGDRNDAIDSIDYAALFRVIGADSTTLLVVETDDGVTNLDDKATGKTLINAYKDLKISFPNGKADVRFFVDGQPVAEDVTFDMSAYSGCLQPFMQLQKTSDNNTDGFTVCDVIINYRMD